MKKGFLIMLSAFMFITMKPEAQNTSARQITSVQPKIMVIPYTKEGEDIRTILEQDVNKRIVLTKIKEAFDSRGFTTVDFVAKLKAVSQNEALSAGTKNDLKSMIIQNSGADIYVEAENNVLLSDAGNSVKIILTGYECSTGNSLANKVGESGRFYTDDIGKLAERAVGTIAEDFLNILETKFNDIIANGQSVNFDIRFAEGSSYSMSSNVGTQGLQLSDEIENWMEKHAYKNNYHIQGTTDKLMIIDDVHIPLTDPETGNNYNLNKFAREFLKFTNTLGISITRTIKGNTLYIVIK